MNKHIALFIDDNPTNNYLIQLTIEFDKLPIDAQTLEGGEEALDYLKNCSRSIGTVSFPKFIFLDINMPRMNGFEFLKQYEDMFLHKFPATKIFLMTSSIRESDKEKAHSFKSVHGFFCKPFTAEIFEQALAIVNNNSAAA